MFSYLKRTNKSLCTFFTHYKQCFQRNLTSANQEEKAAATKKSFRYSDIKLHCTDESMRSLIMAEEQHFGFGKTFSDHMLKIEWTEEKGWGKPEISQFHDINLHPASKVFHYAQELFEGLKACRSSEEQILLFRPDLNIKRMLESARRASLPEFDGNEFLKCLKALISIDERWVPYKRNQSLYIRPTFIGTEPSLGVGASKRALLYTICGPVSSYFETEGKAISLLADPSFVRTWPGGVGDTKMGCNYAPTIYVQRIAEQQNHHQVLWLYGENHQLAEIGTMNIFIYLMDSNGGTELITPPLDGTILPGVTRQTVLDLANKWKVFKVSERNITMKEIIQAKKENRLLEIFGTGTACVISPVGSITYLNEKISIPTLESKYSLYKRLLNEILSIQYGDIASDWSHPVY